MATRERHHVVVVGGGFGGLYTVRKLRNAAVRITLVDRRNFHLFQPLLYQVATGGLSPADIASPLRHIFRRQRNVQVILGDAIGVDPAQRRLRLRDGELSWDTLVIAAGIANQYYGRDDWEPLAPGLKSLEDAVEIRRRVLLAFEAAELEPDLVRRQAWMTFVIVGAGPTGVELAGAVGELAHHTLRREFRNIDPTESRIILLEGTDRVLPSFQPSLSARAKDSLIRLGVETWTATRVTDVDAGGVDLERDGQRERLPAHTVLWGAGTTGVPLAHVLQEQTGCTLDPMGRVVVGPDLTVPGHPDLFVIGDLAHVEFRGKPLPAIAPAAIQQGTHVARLIRDRLAGQTADAPFRYFDKGALATIGRSAAVAEFRGLRFWGFPAWLVWLVIHIVYLIGFENRIMVMIQWINMYIGRRRGARLILNRPSEQV
jgi:NADH:ubiquinone reductase (H+-translocating)